MNADFPIFTIIPTSAKKKSRKLKNSTPSSAKLSLKDKRLGSSIEKHKIVDLQQQTNSTGNLNENATKQFSNDKSYTRSSAVCKTSVDYQTHRGKENYINRQELNLQSGENAGTYWLPPKPKSSVTSAAKSTKRRSSGDSSSSSSKHLKREKPEYRSLNNSATSSGSAQNHSPDYYSCDSLLRSSSDSVDRTLATDSMLLPQPKPCVHGDSVHIVSDSSPSLKSNASRNSVVISDSSPGFINKTSPSSDQHIASSSKSQSRKLTTPPNRRKTIVITSSESSTKSEVQSALDSVERPKNETGGVASPLMSTEKLRQIEHWLQQSEPETPPELSKEDMLGCVEMLKDLYGDKQDFTKCFTEPRRKKQQGVGGTKGFLQQIHGAGVMPTTSVVPQTEPKKTSRLSTGSTSDDNFEEFLKKMRSVKKTTSKKPQIATPEFINDDTPSGPDTPTFYLSTNTKPRDARVPRVHHSPDGSSSDCGKLPINRALTFTSTDSSKDDSPPLSEKTQVKVRKKTHVRKKIPPPTTAKPEGKKSKAAARTKLCTPPDGSPTFGFLESLSAKTPTRYCDPEARYYKKNFKKTREELCSRLFALYNARVFDNKLPDDMLIEWNIHMRRTAGFCYNRKDSTGLVRSARIVLSIKVIAKPDRLRDTLIHEMCHAAAWILDGVRNGHGTYWKAWARRAEYVFPVLPVIKRCHNYEIETKFTYRCVSCGYSVGRHSKSLDITKKRCGYCLGSFELLVNGVPETTRRSPQGFARFVKENYASVKKSKEGLKHGDVMKLLGQQFSAVKIVGQEKECA